MQATATQPRTPQRTAPTQAGSGGAATGGAPAPRVAPPAPQPSAPVPPNQALMDRYGWTPEMIQQARGTTVQATGTTPTTTQVVRADVSGIAPGYDTPAPRPSVPAGGIGGGVTQPGGSGGFTLDDFTRYTDSLRGTEPYSTPAPPSIPSNQEDVLRWYREGIEGWPEFEGVAPGGTTTGDMRDAYGRYGDLLGSQPGFRGVAPGSSTVGSARGVLDDYLGMIGNQPGFEGVAPGSSTMGDADNAFDMYMGLLGNQPGFQGVDVPGGVDTSASEEALDWYRRAVMDSPEFYDVAPGMSAGTSGLDDQLLGYTEDWLDTPSRYDTELFNQLWESGLGNLDAAQDRRMQEILEGSNQRLGPASGQLTNQYIDLEAEYARDRSDLLAGLAREQALTYGEDRAAAYGAGAGLVSDRFGREQGLRDEQRTERSDELGYSLANKGALEDYGRFTREGEQLDLERGQSLRDEERGELEREYQRYLDQLTGAERGTELGLDVSGMRFGQESAIRDEARTERDTEYDRYLDRLMAQERGASLGLDFSREEFDQGSALRSEDRLERDTEYNRYLDQLTGAERGFGMAGDLTREQYDQERGLRDEQRTEREVEYGREQDRLDRIGEFGQYDRQLGRDATDDYFNQVAADQGWTRLEMDNASQTHNQFMDVAEFYRDAPGYIGGQPAGAQPAEAPWGGDAFPRDTDMLNDMWSMDPEEFSREYGTDQDEAKAYWLSFVGDIYDMPPDEFEAKYGMPHDEATQKYQEYISSGENPPLGNAPGARGGRTRTDEDIDEVNWWI